MGVRYYALTFGIIYLLFSIAGFIYGLNSPPPEYASGLVVTSGYGYLFGLFPVNILHSLINLIIGVWGILVFRSAMASRVYAQVLTFVFGALLIMGMIPGLNTIFGLIPLDGNNTWLHGISGLISIYFGFIQPNIGRATEA